MSDTDLRPRGIDTSKYIITHVFCPLQLPDGDDSSVRNDYSLAGAVATAARLFCDHVDEANIPQWHSVSRMLENLQVTVMSEDLSRFQTTSLFSSMGAGGTLSSFHNILASHNK